MSILTGAAAAGIGALGNLAGSAMSYNQQKKLLEKQQAFEREKAQNYHQWEVGDLQAAGLNPILSANNGTSLGSPSAPAVSTPDIGGPITAAMERSLKKKSIENQKILMDAQAKQAISSAKQAEATAKKAETEETILKAQAQAQAPRLKQEEKYNKSAVGSTLNYIGMGAKDLQPATNILGTVGGLWWGGRMLGTANAVKRRMEQGTVFNGTKTSPIKVFDTKGKPVPMKKQYYSPTRQEWINQPTLKRGQMRY